MSAKELIGLALTALAIIVIIAGFVVGGGKISGDMALAATFMGFVVLVLGPWLWLGDVPIAVRKFVEARTGKKLPEGGRK